METIYEEQSTPRQDGYRMPGEFEPQERIWMLWPHRPDWSGDGVGGTSSLLRTLRTVRGGVMELGVRRDVASSTHRQKYLLRERELADLLDRATALRGRWKALLVRDPRQYFTLTRGSTADKAILYVRDNGAKDGFIPNQRLWIALPGGDVLLRRLVAVETANVGELALHLSSELGVTVPPASRVGRERRRSSSSSKNSPLHRCATPTVTFSSQNRPVTSRPVWSSNRERR